LTEHPYRAALKRDLDALTDEVLGHLDEGFELPFDEEIVHRAERRLTYRHAAIQARDEGHRLTAWLIRRLIK
jgi:hypothetical protein